MPEARWLPRGMTTGPRREISPGCCPSEDADNVASVVRSVSRSAPPPHSLPVRVSRLPFYVPSCLGCIMYAILVRTSQEWDFPSSLRISSQSNTALQLCPQQAVEACRLVRRCLDSRLTDGGKVVSPTHRQRSTAQKLHVSASGTHCC
jgi:hypothetical protein